MFFEIRGNLLIFDMNKSKLLALPAISLFAIAGYNNDAKAYNYNDYYNEYNDANYASKKSLTINTSNSELL